MPSSDMKNNVIPMAHWVPCGMGLPPEGSFVWVCVGRVIESGEARRYQREVHMGVYRGSLPNEQFKIYPYHQPICSNQVWAWAPMTPPAPPVCRSLEEEEHSYDEEEDE